MLPALFIGALMGCSVAQDDVRRMNEGIDTLPFIEGKAQYLASPFVTAGDRVYMVGYQNGTFPDLGWHIEGEMGGIWDHPIKLMDGFTAQLKVQHSTDVFCLDNAIKFINYPMANSHHFAWTKEDIEVDRFQFVPDDIEGAIIEFRISNHTGKAKQLDFSFTGITDLRPTWLGERTKMIDGEDEIVFDEDSAAFVAKDKHNPWYVMFGSSSPAHGIKGGGSCEPAMRKGLGREGTLSYAITIESNGQVVIPIFIAGSYQSEASARSTFEILRTKATEKLTQKIERYRAISNASKLTIPDKDISQMFEWLKYNTDWLVRNVPEQGVGLSAGLPDYPWWFGADATYALQGVLATGDHALVKNTIQLLHKLSQRANDNGRIVHEVSTSGAVYNPGNVNETAQFITLVNTYYSWTGDKDLVSGIFPDLKDGMRWLMDEKDPDGNLYPNGSGMMEIPGLESQLEMIDVAAYTQQALASMAELSRALGETTAAKGYSDLAEELEKKINSEWWLEGARSYGDFRATLAEATPVLDAALIRSDTLGKSWAVDELKQTQKNMKGYVAGQAIPHVIYHNWVVNTPMETGIAEPAKALAALKNAKTYENAFGVFVTGIDRTIEPDSIILKSRKKTFSYTGAVMTLPTSVLAVAAAKYEGPDAALQYIRKLHQSFSYALPGSMYEVSPDFGMFTQAWNIYGVAVPIVHYFFGIHPKAYEKRIYVSPTMPTQWKEVSLDHVKVGDNFLSIAISQKEDHKVYHLQQSKADWSLMINVKGAKKVLVNDKEVELKSLADSTLELHGSEMNVQIY
ncbi:MAG TPA: hypothetical protein VK666_17885 [Chryseolinea sp.]|nr:hypothetical protein [Chryseolinea sp.]